MILLILGILILLGALLASLWYFVNGWMGLWVAGSKRELTLCFWWTIVFGIMSIVILSFLQAGIILFYQTVS